MWIMDAKELFVERYRGFQEYPAILLDGMTEQQLRGAPHPALNPIVWILWHTARCEDMGINRLLVDRAQMLNEDSWASRLNGPERQIGTGMTKPEVEQLAEQLDLAELLAYRTAVTERTVEVLEGLPTEELMQKLSVDRLRQVFADEGAGGTAANWLGDVYEGHTKGWLVGHIALTHHYYHIGQAFAVRAMYGLPNPW